MAPYCRRQSVRHCCRRAKTQETHVEEVVGTGKLLEHLECHHEERAVELPVLEREAVPEAGLDLLLVLKRALHVLELATDHLVVLGLLDGDTARPCERLAGLVEAALAREPTGRLGHGEDTDTEDDGPDETDTDEGPPGAGALDVTGADGDTVGNENTESDEQLVCGGKGTTDGWWRGLSLVLEESMSRDRAEGIMT